MRIGVIGAGNLGTALARRLRGRGHELMLSFSREREKLERVAADVGAGAGTVAEAAEFGEVAILATPWMATAEALEQAGGRLRGKILWDATNALKPDLSGLMLGALTGAGPRAATSGGEEVARMAPGARVVKAIPPFAEALHARGDGGAAVFVCSDDAGAAAVVAELVRAIGADPVAAGGLEMARYTEPAGMLLVQLAYKRGLGGRIGLVLQKG